MRLGPRQLAGLSFHLEVLVAFGTAETKDPGVIAHEGDALGRINGSRAEMARFDSVSEQRSRQSIRQHRTVDNEEDIPHVGRRLSAPMDKERLVP